MPGFHSFLRPSNSPPYGWTTQCGCKQSTLCTSVICWGYLGCLHALAVVDNAALNMGVPLGVRPCFQYFGVAIQKWKCMVIAFLIFQGPATQFSRPPSSRNLSFVPRSASRPPLRLLLLCLPCCPLSLAHPGPFLSLCQNAGPSWDPGSGLLSDLQSHPWCLHSLQQPPFSSATAPNVSLWFWFPSSYKYKHVRTASWPGPGPSPSLASGVPHRRQQWAPGQSWGRQAGGTGCPGPCSRYTARGTGRGFTRTYTFPPTSPG